MRIGVLGGTFNPIHCAHIRTALAAKSALSLDRVLLMVAADPPHKQVAGAVPAQVRLHMTALAAEEYQGLEASALELHRAGKSYTADTLLSLHKQYPEDELFLLVGSDMLRDLPNWYRPDCICRLAVIAVVSRGGCDAEDTDRAQLLMKEFGARVVYLRVAPQTLSSTEIRSRLYRGLPVTGLLPPAVETELYESGIYFPERIHALQQRCRAALTEKRYAHTMAVVRRTAELCARHGAEPEQARLAALLHDCAKCMPEAVLRVLSGDDTGIAPVQHAFAGAVLAKTEYGVRDETVLRAIRLHSTGDAGMTALDMLVYLADMTEHTRSFRGVETLRDAANESLTGGMRRALRRTVGYLEQRKQPVHPATFRAIKALEIDEEVRI